MSAFIRTEANSEATNRIVFKNTNNGGQSWFTVAPANLGFSSSTSLATPTGIDAKASDPANNVFVPYTRVGTPQIAFDRFSNVYLTYGEYNDDNTSGRIILRRFAFSGTTFSETNFPATDNFTLGGEKVLYRWVDADEAYNPTVAIDTNLASNVDPDTTLSLASGPRPTSSPSARRTSTRPASSSPGTPATCNRSSGQSTRTSSGWPSPTTAG